MAQTMHANIKWTQGAIGTQWKLPWFGR